MQSASYQNSSINQQGYAEGEGIIARHEKVQVDVMDSAKAASILIAQKIGELIKERGAEGKKLVLGLATGSTPLMVYQELIRMHREEGLSFKNVVTFNLDEYYPLPPDHPESFHFFMWERLFKHIDILPENVHIPVGNLKRDEVEPFCKAFEQQIKNQGGIDLLLLGIGRTGHIGFNEPGSPLSSKTRIVTLDHLTRNDASDAFHGEDSVPRNAITMGIHTILSAREIYLLAWGEGKAEIIKKAVEEIVSDSVPASFLQNHPNATFIIDRAAAVELTRFKAPWLVGKCHWEKPLIRKAVVWLCTKVKKPILKLTEQDYKNNGLRDLITNHGPFSKINIDVFNDLQHTITGWPGGKPGVDDATRPERAFPYPKRVIIFSPHPDDDVISMGGTFARLVQQNHDVHVAYQTSGNIAVSDEEVLKYLDFVQHYDAIFYHADRGSKKIYRDTLSYFQQKNKESIETKEFQSIKGAIRQGEAKASCRYIGLSEDKIKFLNYPFYESGTIKKHPAGEEEVNMTKEYLRSIKPHQIYAAGDLSDPHGTHRVCIDILLEALRQMKEDEWLKDCRVWLYRGAWQEWEIELVNMAVPLSPEEVEIKRNAIFRHQSQKDGALFMGSDKREFWQRAEERNRNTARLYDQLGMAEYEAIEVFVRYEL